MIITSSFIFNQAGESTESIENMYSDVAQGVICREGLGEFDPPYCTV